MSKKSQKSYQFKITLEDIKPAIWRRIQVPENYTFWDLHVAIQDSMGWLDCHLHHFELGERDFFGIPDDDGYCKPDWKKRISSYFFEPKQKCLYEYDFGDSWRHKVTLEKILPLEPDFKYPRCIAGKRACPPEDCGGVWGYEDLLEILKDPDHDEHEERMEWIGDDFDPENFNLDSVRFSDPKECLEERKSWL